MPIRNPIKPNTSVGLSNNRYRWHPLYAVGVRLALVEYDIEFFDGDLLGQRRDPVDQPPGR